MRRPLRAIRTVGVDRVRAPIIRQRAQPGSPRAHPSPHIVLAVSHRQTPDVRRPATWRGHDDATGDKRRHIKIFFTAIVSLMVEPILYIYISVSGRQSTQHSTPNGTHLLERIFVQLAMMAIGILSTYVFV